MRSAAKEGLGGLYGDLIGEIRSEARLQFQIAGGSSPISWTEWRRASFLWRSVQALQSCGAFTGSRSGATYSWEMAVQAVLVAGPSERGSFSPLVHDLCVDLINS